MIRDFLGAVVGHIAQRNAHFGPGFAVDVVETHLGSNENFALGHLLTIFLGNVVHAHHGVTVRPLLVGDFGIALAKFRAVPGHAGFFDMTPVWPTHGRPQNSIAHFFPSDGIRLKTTASILRFQQSFFDAAFQLLAAMVSASSLTLARSCDSVNPGKRRRVTTICVMPKLS